MRATSSLKRLWQWLKLGWRWQRTRQASTTAGRQAARRALALQMADARGLPMKIGQIMAGMGDDEAFRLLTQSIEPWPLQTMRPVLQQAWGCAPETYVRQLDESQAAASLGQVHKAVLHDGQSVAIKLQYPDIGQALHAEMRLSDLLPGMGPVKRWQFDLDAYRQVLADDMQRELDYQREAAMQQRFADAVDVPGLCIPAVMPTLCRKQVLVQQWYEGQRLATATTWSLAERVQLARTLMMTLFQSLFVHGLVHGDPHPGNLLVSRAHGQVMLTLLDFGCMLEIEEARRMALLRLILAQRGETSVQPLDAWAAMGFDARKLDYIAPQLAPLGRILFYPFYHDAPLDAGRWQPGQQVAALLGDQRWWFRSAGPADLFLLMRVFQGLLAQLQLLDVKLPWWPVLMLAVPEHIRQQALNWPVPHLASEHQMPTTAAQHLKVAIVRQQAEDIHMAMPASEAFRLSELIPQDVQQQLARQQLNVQQLEARISEEGLQPRELFSLQTDDAHYRVWLE